MPCPRDGHPASGGVRTKLQGGAVRDAIHAQRTILEFLAAVEQLGLAPLESALRHRPQLLELGSERLRSLICGECHLEILGASHLDGDVGVLLDEQMHNGVVRQTLLYHRRGVIELTTCVERC